MSNQFNRFDFNEFSTDNLNANRNVVFSFEYKNEAGGDPPDKPTNAPDFDNDGNGPKSYSIPVYSTHQLVIENIAFYMEEFRIGKARNTDTINKHVEASPAAEQFYSTMSELPDIQLVTNQTVNDEVSSCSDDDNDNDDFSDINRTEALQIASFSGKMDIKITVKVSFLLSEMSSINSITIKHIATCCLCQLMCIRNFSSKRYQCKGQKWKCNFNWEL